MSNQKVLLGLAAGVAVGAALGILFAPDKGSETRKKISTKGNDYKNGLKDKFGSLVDSASEKMESVKSRINELTGHADAVANNAADKTSRTAGAQS